MATAGSPLKVIPVSARAASKAVQFGRAADTMVRTADETKDATITGFRPHTSESEPATSMDTASRPVVSESDRLLAAAPTLNSCENTGSSGCTQ